MLQQEPLSLLLEEETDAQRGHSLCHGTGALGFYCGLSVPFVTTRQHCLFLSLRSKQSGREASVGGLVIYCNLGTRCWGTLWRLVDAGDIDVLLLPSSHLQTDNSDMERPKWGSVSQCWGQRGGVRLQRRSSSAKPGNT